MIANIRDDTLVAQTRIALPRSMNCRANTGAKGERFSSLPRSSANPATMAPIKAKTIKITSNGCTEIL